MLTPYDAVQLLERRLAASSASGDLPGVWLSRAEAGDVLDCIRRLVDASVYAPPPPRRDP